MSYEKGPVCLASFLKAATEVSPPAGEVSRPSSPVLFADRPRPLATTSGLAIIGVSMFSGPPQTVA